MKICLFFVLLSLTIVEVSCEGNKEKFKPMVENIKKTVMAEVPDIKKNRYRLFADKGYDTARKISYTRC